MISNYMRPDQDPSNIRFVKVWSGVVKGTDLFAHFGGDATRIITCQVEQRTGTSLVLVVMQEVTFPACNTGDQHLQGEATVTSSHISAINSTLPTHLQTPQPRAWEKLHGLNRPVLRSQFPVLQRIKRPVWGSPALAGRMRVDRNRGGSWW